MSAEKLEALFDRAAGAGQAAAPDVTWGLLRVAALGGGLEVGQMGPERPRRRFRLDHAFRPLPPSARFVDQQLSAEIVENPQLRPLHRFRFGRECGLSDSAALALISRSDVDDRISLASIESMPVVAMERLARDRSVRVRRTLALNRSLPDRLAEVWLVRERDDEVVHSLLRSPRLKDVEAVWSRSDVDDLVYPLSSRSDLSDELFEFVACRLPARYLAERPAVTADRVGWLVGRFPDAAEHLAKNETLPLLCLIDLVSAGHIQPALVDWRAVLDARDDVTVEEFKASLGVTGLRLAMIRAAAVKAEHLDLLPAGDVLTIRGRCPPQCPSLTFPQLLFAAQLLPSFAPSLSQLFELTLRSE